MTTDFIHMCVTVLANLNVERMEEEKKVTNLMETPVYFNMEASIIPYVNKHWENLTSMPRRVKNTWHATLHKTLTKETELFQVDPNDANSFGLVERDLSLIGPSHDVVRQIGKKTTGTNNLASTLVHAQVVVKVEDGDGGPKTRGASKRRKEDVTIPTTKKTKVTSDYSTTRVPGTAITVDIPFNKEGYKYYVIEKDHNVHDRSYREDEETTHARVIPAHIYRMAIPHTVTLSPNDRAYQLSMSPDNLSVTGFEGYSMARATHSVCSGTWYYEVDLLREPKDTYVRIGWSLPHSPVQACVGYTKFSYSWRSWYGTKFNDGFGKTYARPGYGEGDVLGCLISLPEVTTKQETNWSANYLPASGKEFQLIKYKSTYFFEGNDDHKEAVKTLKTAPGSKIEFFLNGVSCGVAYTDIHAGFYYPAVSIYQGATLRCNFGPTFKFPPPKGVRPMSDRAEELHVHQTMSDMLYIVEHNLVPSPKK